MSIQQNFPGITPTLSLNFARSKKLDPRITFTRTSSATRVNETGLVEVVPANAPRFDHSYDPVSGSVKSLGLLIEESRTNLALWSEEFGTTWLKENSSISENSIISPDGSLTADSFIEDNVNASHYIYQGTPVLSGVTFTASIYAKKGTRSWIQIALQFARFGGNVWANFNLDTGTIGSIGSSTLSTKIENVGNDWYRCSITGTTISSGANGGCVFTILDSDRNERLPLYQGDGTSGIYIWGAQLEQGAFPTSYIPTAATTATRTTDNAKIDGKNFTDFYNPSEGTVYTQFRCDNWNVSNSFGKVFTINEGIFGVENNGFWIGNDANTSNSVRYRVRASGINQFGPANLIRTSNVVKSVIAVKTSDFAVTIDGNTPATSTSGTLSTSMTNMTIGRNIVGIDNTFLNGTISQLTYYPVRLSNQILQNLTK